MLNSSINPRLFLHIVPCFSVRQTRKSKCPAICRASAPRRGLSRYRKSPSGKPLHGHGNCLQGAGIPRARDRLHQAQKSCPAPHQGRRFVYCNAGRCVWHKYHRDAVPDTAFFDFFSDFGCYVYKLLRFCGLNSVAHKTELLLIKILHLILWGLSFAKR